MKKVLIFAFVVVLIGVILKLTAFCHSHPPDVPILPTAQNLQIQDHNAGLGVESYFKTITFTTTDSIDQILDYYRSAAYTAGWQHTGGTGFQEHFTASPNCPFKSCPNYTLIINAELRAGMRFVKIELLEEICA